MRAGVVLCAVIGHRWRVDDASTGHEAVICCRRCGRRQVAPDGTVYDRRVAVQTSRDRVVGPLGRRR